VSRFRRHVDQRGSATAFCIAFTALLVTIALVGATVASMLIGQRRAASGADLAALAGASAVQHGEPGCGEAADLAAANGVRLVRCETRREVVTVVVATEVVSLLGSAWTVKGRARAGPVS